MCIFSSFVVRLVEIGNGKFERLPDIFFSMATYFTIESSPAGNLLL